MFDKKKINGGTEIAEYIWGVTVTSFIHRERWQVDFFNCKIPLLTSCLIKCIISEATEDISIIDLLFG